MHRRGAPQPDVRSPPVTALLQAWGAGDQSALDRLMPLVVDELRRLARLHMRRQQHGHVLQTTALVNEAYLRLVDRTRVRPTDRAHFMALASRLMRHVLVDVARAERAFKRGGGLRPVPFDETTMAVAEPVADLVALDDALKTLAAVDPRKSQVVELRFFGGLSVDETADALHVSPETVTRDWRIAKVWLMREITREKRG